MKENKYLTLTNLDYLSGDYKVANLGITAYYLSGISALYDELADFDKAIQNFNATLGLNTGITRKMVTDYLRRATEYHAAIVTFKKLYDRRNFYVQGIKQFKEMESIRPKDVIINKSITSRNQQAFEDIKYSPVEISNAKWINQYLNEYVRIKLPFSVYGIVNQLFGSLFVTSDQPGTSYYELFPKTLTKDFLDLSELDYIKTQLKEAYEASPFMDDLLQFMGFSNVQTDELLLQSDGTSPSLAEDRDLEWAIANTVHNKRNSANNMFVRFNTPNTHLDSLGAMLNIPLEELSTLIFLDMEGVSWGGQAIMEDRVWKNKTTINTTQQPLGWGGFVGSVSEMINFLEAVNEQIIFHWLHAELNGSILNYEAIDTFKVYMPRMRFIVQPNSQAEVRWDRTKPALIEHNTVFGGGVVYRLNYDKNIESVLKNTILFGSENFPTVYVPFKRLNAVE